MTTLTEREKAILLFVKCNDQQILGALDRMLDYWQGIMNDVVDNEENPDGPWPTLVIGQLDVWAGLVAEFSNIVEMED